MLDAALDYAARGWPVFPLIGKVPAISKKNGGNGLLDAVTDSDEVRALFARAPHATGVGIALPAGIVVLDVDTQHGGDVSFRLYNERYGAEWLENVPRQRTGNGGLHLVFRHDGPLVHVSPAYPGVETKVGGKGYIVAEPSVHPNGNVYRWEVALPHVDDIVDQLPTSWVEVLTPAPPRQPSGTTYAPGDDPVDNAAHNYTSWPALLHEWELISGDGESDGSLWKHPNATNDYSASMRHGCLFVYSPNTALPQTTPGDPHGVTLYNGIRLLEFGGNYDRTNEALGLGKVAFEREFEEMCDAHERTYQQSRQRIDWTSRPWLKHISDAAHARLVSREAVLQCVLARVAAFTSHRVRLPAIVGSEVGLTYFAAIVAEPGVGKSAAVAVAKQLWPAPDDMGECDDLPLGTGEGIVEVLFEMVDVGEKHKVKRQTRYNAFIVADEGETFAALGVRKGATLGPTLRTMWTGAAIGQTNATKDRARKVLPLEYVYGVVFLFQPAKAGDLLAEEEGGTPQRFAWALGTDATIPDVVPTWPGMLVRYELQYLPGVMEVDDEVRSGVIAAHRAKQQGAHVDALDAHRMLLRLKVAALVAVIEGRQNITCDDWALAEDVVATSDAARAQAVGAVKSKARRAETAATKKAVRRKVAEVEAVDQHEEARRRRLVIEVACTIAERVWKTDEEITERVLRRGCGPRRRDVFEEALEHAEAEEWIVRRTERVQGARGTGEKKLVERGAKRP